MQFGLPTIVTALRPSRAGEGRGARETGPASSSSSSSSYRADIDGLRAVAVIAVVLGHAFEEWFPGGYLGVDVFFVISGFVITHSLFGRGAASFGSFFAAFSLRRIKRILPALLVCAGLTCAVLLVIDPAPRTSLRTGFAALFGASNFSLYFQELDYFSPSIRFNAFTHTWSLGVEEQFYLLFPLMFWFLFRPAGRGTAPRFLAVISAFSAASLAGFVLLQTSAPMAAYYMMPLRFWELGAGVAAATLLHLRPHDIRAARWSLLPPAGVLCAMAALFAIPPDAKFAGHIAIVLLTAVLLLLGASPAFQSPLLTNRPARYVGNISYSFYLWHWPFLTFGLFLPDRVWANPFFAMACAFCVAALSYHFVEQPFRRIRVPQPRLSHFAAALVCVLSVVGLVALGDMYRNSLIKAALRPGFLPLPDSNLKYHPTCVVDGQGLPLQTDTFENCTFPPIAGGRETSTLWVMGDSHAGHLQGALIKLRDDLGYGFHLVETPGIVFPVTVPGGFAPRETLFEKVRDAWKPGDAVVISRLFLSRTEPVSVAADVAEWIGKVDLLARQLAQSGIGLVLVGPPPMFRFEDIRACDPSRIQRCSIARDSLDSVSAAVNGALAGLADGHENTAFVEIFSEFCPADAPICGPTRDGVFLFRDRDHLNSEGAALLAGRIHAALDALR